MYRTLSKALTLARRFGAKLELFLCDSQHASSLKHSYIVRETDSAWRATDPVRARIPESNRPSLSGDDLEMSRATCLADGQKYLESLKDSLRASDVQISLDVACHA